MLLASRAWVEELIPKTLRSESESPAEFEALHDIFRRGDILGVTGTVVRTKAGELSVVPCTILLLSPNLHQLPKAHFGFKDQESRHRKRYLDLIMNKERREVFVKRARVVNYIRRFLDNLGFLEVRRPPLLIPRSRFLDVHLFTFACLNRSRPP